MRRGLGTFLGGLRQHLLVFGLDPPFLGFGSGYAQRLIREVDLIGREQRADDHGDDEKGHCGSQGRDFLIAEAPSPQLRRHGDGPRHDRLSDLKTMQVLGQGADIGIAPRGVLLQGLQADCLDVAVHLGLELRGGYGLLVSDHVQSVEGRRPVERRPAREQLVEDRAERVLVGGGPDSTRLAPRLFGSHIARRAEDGEGVGPARLPLQLLHQPEVGDLEGAIFREQDIGRLEVTMDDLFFMRMGDLDRASQHFHDSRGLGRRLGLAPDLLRQVATGEEFEREVGQSIVLADLEDANDVRMFDPGDRPRLGLEPLDDLGSRSGPGPDHLQGHEPVQSNVSAP